MAPAARQHDTIRRVSGIVLAGGRASRFGGDKLSTVVQGRALVEYAIETLSRLCAEVILVVGPSGTPPQPTSTAANVGIARDHVAGGGPVAGLVAGLASARHPVVIVVGGDMPALVVEVLDLLAQRIGEGASAAALQEGGAIRPLPCAVERTVALVVAREMRRGSGLRDVLAKLDCQLVPEEDWRPLDPEARTLLDVDTRDDLDGLPADLP